MRFPLAALVGIVAISAGCFLRRTPPLPASIPPAPGETRTAFALRFVDVSAGSGALAQGRKCLFVHYTGWLTNGTKFDSSRDTAQNGKPRDPLSFPQSYRRVVPGWDLGFEGMRVGARRRLFVPYQLAYGEAGRPPIPPKSELIFDIELMGVVDTVAEPRAPNVQFPRCPAWAAANVGR